MCPDEDNTRHWTRGIVTVVPGETTYVTVVPGKIVHGDTLSYAELVWSTSTGMPPPPPPIKAKPPKWVDPKPYLKRKKGRAKRM